jgi:hypothetical protein
MTEDQGRCTLWRETLRQAIRDRGCPPHHQRQGNQQGHPIVGLAPEDHATDKATDQCRHESQYEREGAIAADRETKLLQGLCGVSGGLH